MKNNYKDNYELYKSAYLALLKEHKKLKEELNKIKYSKNDLESL